MTDPNSKTLNGTALVVEDNMIIALDIEDMLLTLGASKVLVATSVSEAIQFIDEQTIDFALLDVNLGSETSVPVGLKLSETDTPFIFTTGHSSQSDISGRFPNVEVVEKPYDTSSIVAAIGAI